MFGIIPLWLVAGAVGWYVGQEHPALAWAIVLGILVSTLVLLGAPGAGLSLVGVLTCLLFLYVVIRFLPVILGLAFGLILGATFFYALIIALGMVVSH